MWSRRFKLSLSAFGLLGPLLLAAPAPINAWASSGAVTFSGQATVVKGTAAGQSVLLADTGPLRSSGGSLDATLLTVSIPDVLKAEVLPATVIGRGDTSNAQASLASLFLTLGSNTISAAFLAADATATCINGMATSSASSEIVDLSVNSQRIVIAGTPNQTVSLPLGQVFINEQNSSFSGQGASITVNALHVVIPAVGLVPGTDLTISSAHADINCGGAPNCTGTDFVTGGGWIMTPSESRANFAVAGGIKDGAPWGHLLYIDHRANGPMVKGTGVTKYEVTGSTSRHIEGAAEVNHQTGYDYLADVADNGQPAAGVDWFELNVPAIYSVGPTYLSGGNIKLHKPCQ